MKRLFGVMVLFFEQSQRNGIIIFLGIILAVLGLANSSLATTYYVATTGNDSNPGTESLPWLTITKANQTLIAGDTVYIKAGTYDTYIAPDSSGTSSSPIVYRNYGTDIVTISDAAYGIYIYKKSYIRVNGIDFYSLRRFMRIYAGHHNTISYCNFDQRSPASGDWVGALIADDPYDNTPASENSMYNWVHHCTFYRWAYGGYDEHRGALLDIGSWASSPVDESYYNLIEDNTFAYGGHHTLGVYSKYNVIRNNYFHNETNPDNWDFEGYRAAITEGQPGGLCLYEGNRFGFSDASGMGLRTPNNIFRFNTFYRNGSGGIQVVSSQAGVDHADSNHIYHNSFYYNGHLATDPGFQGGMYFANWSGASPVGNVVKNCIFYDNKNGSISYEGQVDPQVIENNWDQNDVDPGFVDMSGTDPDNPNLPDLHLKSNSPCIDSGTYLTTVTSPNGSGTTFQVADAGYFMDGWGIAGVQGDEIQLYGSTQRARIISVDYSTKTITVDGNITWAQNQGINLAYEETAPDLGAYEFDEGGVSEEEYLVEVFPNPCRVYQGENTVTFSGELSAGDNIKVFDMSGKTIHDSGELSEATYEWNVSNIASGIFFFVVKSTNGQRKTSGKIAVIR